MAQSTESSDESPAGLNRHVAELEAQLEASRHLVADSRAREQALATHNLVLVGLSRSRAIEQGDVAAALEQITVAAAHTLRLERVSVWLFSDDRSRIRCLDLYERSKNGHSSNMELKAADYPAYFRAVEENRTIAADDASSDPRTCEFTANYLRPLGITSMLDAPVRIGTRLIGLICHEHVGPLRHWTLEEQAFAGSMADFVAMALQARERQQAQDAVRENERRLRQIIDLVPHMVFVKDRHGRFAVVNQAVANAYGTKVEELVGRSLAEVHPDRDEAQAMLAEDRKVLDTGRRLTVAEASFTDHTGAKLIFHKSKVPFTIAGNEPAILGVAVDITDLKRAQEQQQVMIQELDHRVKNTLAQVLAIAEQTAVASPKLEEFMGAFTGRVRSLATAHELLAHARWQGADLRTAVQRTLAPFAPAASGRVCIEGPAVLLSAKLAPPMSMILHELATNAAKHGALSSPNGNVSVEWRISPLADDGEIDELELIWTERGGPTVSTPIARGFGTTFIERTASYQLRGSARLDFEAAGLRCELRIPLQVASNDADAAPASAPEPPDNLRTATPVAARAHVASDRLRVLVVEDDLLVADSLKLMLDQLGCEIIGPAATSDDACRLVRQDDPDAAILDVNLSPGTSAPVARALMMRGRPFTFVTGYSSIRVLPDDLRGFRVLAKPITSGMLEQALREMRTLRALRRS